MLNDFLTFINSQKLELHAAPTLLAISGGVDSVVLATLFKEANLPFILAHCNYGLRGKESDDDEIFVRQWAHKHGVTLFVAHFETELKAKEEGISIQMAARDLRYTWFSELRQQIKYQYLATAHHADDAIETVLLNLTRGTGLAGLTGIAPVMGHTIRPLLFASRQEILAYAQQQNISWREDSSNATDHYRRNLIRHQVLPVLQSINPSLEETFQRTSQRLQAAHRLLDKSLYEWKKNVVKQVNRTTYIPIPELLKASEPIFQLHYLLEPFGFNYAQTEQIVASLEGESGKKFLSPEHVLIKDRKYLIINTLSKGKYNEEAYELGELTSLSIPEKFTIHMQEHTYSDSFNFDPDPSIAYFDRSLLDFPLTIRPWQTGDWFCPLGMKGKRKKVSDLLIDSRVPLLAKRDCFLLTNNRGDVLWVLGFRSDERFKVNKNTKKILEIKFINA
ncbi:tRNA lysidine(34) synthetase TilS [Arundinibacter roseus]|uniref:tRNA(Ile)-lysidine synthase n=1 Tax=Arundinibacter roseus TaxID=2070510 RepID=A0A4V2XAM5_9BACT|nr:tRNA lysidine(34) synthetase TilS [Arundinibacter roseus]TDB68195.1 tRNA lysidine(34) synthetase TilS [Arundinibacter roseus]